MSNPPISLASTPDGYTEWLVDLKSRIHSAQQRAALAVNRELVLLYWQIGRDILARQAEQGWGAKVIERLAHDLRTAFPEMKGFSPRNLKYLRVFFPRIGPNRRLCRRCLHNCRSTTSRPCGTRCQALKPACWSAAARRSPISPQRAQLVPQHTFGKLACFVETGPLAPLGTCRKLTRRSRKRSELSRGRC